nr:hypothetical protein [Ophiocordyceps lanpingensis]
MKNILKLPIWNNIITMMMKHTKPIFILGLLCIIVLLSFRLEIVTLSFDNIIEVLSAIKSILLELKIINHKGMIIKANILALKIKPLLIILLYIGAACITFILTNWKLFLYIILVYIFVKCLLTNFYVKHFKFNKFNINNLTVIWQQRKIIAPFLIKLFLLMIPIRLFIRICTLTLFNFNNDILCIILLVLLTLPFIYYFLNILRKYLAALPHAPIFSCFSFISMPLSLRSDFFCAYFFLVKQEKNQQEKRACAIFTLKNTKAHTQQHNRQSNSVSEQDYFLFNDYVIKNINLYNIIYMIFIVLMINYYFYYYLAIIFLSLVILILLVLYYPLRASQRTQEKQQDPSFNNIHLQASSPPMLTFTWACLMDNLGAYLTWGAGEGYNGSNDLLSLKGFNINDQTNYYNQFVLRNVYPNHFNSDINTNKHGIATCYNWLHRSVAPAKDGVWFTEEKDIQHAIIIAQSKILSMLYMQRYVVSGQAEFQLEVGTLNYKPQTLFKNDKFIGSVGKINNTLVINFLKNDGQLTSKRQFFPSYYVHDESLRHVNHELEPIRQTIEFLEQKYGIYIPNKDNVHNIITNTESEKLRGGDPSLMKIMRPCPLFTDLYTMYETPNKYFLCWKWQNWDYLKGGTLHNKILALRRNVQHIHKTDENRFVSENILNELYCEYLNTRLAVFDPIVKVEADLLFNSTRGHFFYNYKSDNLKSVLLFRQDDLDIFHFQKYCLIDMTWTRQRLLEKVENYNIYSSFYVVSANRVSMELLSIERPYGELPMIYSIIDFSNMNTSSKLKAFTLPKQSFNILDKQDGETLEKLLKYQY